jgi:membrane protein
MHLSPEVNGMSIIKGFKMLKSAAVDFGRDDAMTLAAALAFYGALSMAPLLLILLAVTSLLGPNVQQSVIQQIQNMVGERAGSVIGEIVQQGSQQRSAGWIGAVLGFVALLFSATGAFGQMQHSLNKIWDVQPKATTAWLWLRKRLLSLLLVLGIGLILLASLGLSAAMNLIFAGAGGYLWQIANAVGMLVIFTVLFALIYKVLPDVEISWKDVWVGAFITGILFEVGRFLIGLYLGRSSVASPYGAAGSLVLLLLWVYYASLIFFLGAELTQTWAAFHGRRFQPEAYAEETPEAREKKERQMQEVGR